MLRINNITEYDSILERFIKKNTFNKFLYNDSINKFTITKQKEGIYPAVITISGFLSEDFENNANWKNSITTTYPHNEWYHLEWNTQQNPFQRFSKLINKENRNSALDTNASKLKLLYILGLAPIIGYYYLIPKALINNLWHLAVRNSRHTGKLLAEILTACNHQEFIIIGHSLGARVIHNCLESISSSNITSNIKEVHLLGGAVNSRKAKWTKTNNSVKESIFNYYSKNDKILERLYSISMIDKYPIGINEIDLPNVHNIDTSKTILGHTEYIPNFHKIKANK